MIQLVTITTAKKQMTKKIFGKNINHKNKQGVYEF